MIPMYVLLTVIKCVPFYITKMGLCSGEVLNVCDSANGGTRLKTVTLGIYVTNQ